MAEQLQLSARRPLTRGDCLPGGAWAARPCPWASCRYHLWATVAAAAERRGDQAPAIEALTESCALDVADLGGATLEECSATLQVSRERVRQLEGKALAVFRKRLAERGIGEAEVLAALSAVSRADAEHPWTLIVAEGLGDLMTHEFRRAVRRAAMRYGAARRRRDSHFGWCGLPEGRHGGDHEGVA